MNKTKKEDGDIYEDVDGYGKTTEEMYSCKIGEEHKEESENESENERTITFNVRKYDRN